MIALSLADCEQHRLINSERRAVRANHRGSVRLSNATAQPDHFGQGVGGQIPTIEFAVLAVDQDRFPSGIDSGGIDAPFAHRAGEVRKAGNNSIVPVTIHDGGAR